MTEWYRNTWSDVVKILESDSKNGLKINQIEERKIKNNGNRIIMPKNNTTFLTILKYFLEPWFVALFICFAISAYLKLPVCTLSLFLIILGNILILLRKKNEEKKKLKELEKLNDSLAMAIRDGKIYRVSSEDLVIGDIVLFDKGTIISADLRIIECEDLKVRETVVTGENLVAEKYATKIEDREISLSEMKNILFKSSTVISGTGTGIVIATGLNTEIGKIIQMLLTEKKTKHSIEDSIQEILNQFSLIGLLFATLVFGIEFFLTRSISSGLYSFLTALGASVPEGLILIIAIVAMLVSKKMKKENIMFKNLSIAQLLSGVNVICTDKLGAFSENKMIASEAFVDDSTLNLEEQPSKLEGTLERIIHIGLLCNNFKVNIAENLISGDLSEIGIVKFGLAHSMIKTKYDQEHIRVLNIPYDSERKIMTTINKLEDKYRSNSKGSTDSLLSMCTHIMKNGVEKPITNDDIDAIKSADIEMSNRSLVVVGFAYRNFNYEPSLDENIESNLVFTGLIGFYNPIKNEAAAGIKHCRKEGIKPIIFTEDNKLAAFALGENLSITKKNDAILSGIEIDNMQKDELKRRVAKTSIFSKINSEHKLKIVKLLKEYGCTVLITGSKLTDLPYLKTANIGIATGKKCSSTVKNLSDIFLEDNNFHTLLSLVEESRKIITSIKEILLYVSLCRFSELIFIMLSILVFQKIPLAPEGALWLNVASAALFSAILLSEFKPHKLERHKPITIHKYIFKEEKNSKMLFKGSFVALMSIISYYIFHFENENAALHSALYILSCGQSFFSFLFISNKKFFFENKILNLYVFLFFLFQSALLLLVDGYTIFKGHLYGVPLAIWLFLTVFIEFIVVVLIQKDKKIKFLALRNKKISPKV